MADANPQVKDAPPAKEWVYIPVSLTGSPYGNPGDLVELTADVIKELETFPTGLLQRGTPAAVAAHKAAKEPATAVPAEPAKK